jgi:hypothetical protein
MSSKKAGSENVCSVRVYPDKLRKDFVFDREPGGREYQAYRDRIERGRSAIDQFEGEQQHDRKAASFEEMADWYQNGTKRPLDDAAGRLQKSVERGDFETNGESRVMFLHEALLDVLKIDPSDPTLPKLTRTMLRNVIDTCPAAAVSGQSTLWRQYLSKCWISRADAIHWFKAQNLDVPAPLVESPRILSSTPRPGGTFPARADQPADTPEQDEAISIRSGLKGRPNSAAHALRELDRRIAALKPGEYLGDTERAVAESLCQWLDGDFRKKQPDVHSMKPKSLTNNPQFRERVKPHLGNNLTSSRKRARN